MLKKLRNQLLWDIMVEEHDRVADLFPPPDPVSSFYMPESPLNRALKLVEEALAPPLPKVKPMKSKKWHFLVDEDEGDSMVLCERKNWVMRTDDPEQVNCKWCLKYMANPGTFPVKHRSVKNNPRKRKQ